LEKLQKTDLWIVEFILEGLDILVVSWEFFVANFFFSAAKILARGWESKCSNGRFSEEPIGMLRNEVIYCGTNCGNKLSEEGISHIRIYHVRRETNMDWRAPPNQSRLLILELS
jgi:hypothetical protein